MRDAGDPEGRDEATLFAQSVVRSRERRSDARRRRRRRRRLGLVAPSLAAVVGALAVTVAPKAWESLPSLDAVGAGAATPLDAATGARFGIRRAGADGGRSVSVGPGGPARVATSAADADRARRFLASRDGLASFAVIDSRGRMRSAGGEETYVSASAVKALLLAAELRRIGSEGAPLDPATREALSAMITYSDNDAADTIYYRVGDTGLKEVAARAGMESFSVAGHWTAARVTAEDLARFFWRLDRLLAGPHEVFAKGLLGSVVPAQRWGIPAAAGESWSVRFKGGWRATELGQLAHQAAELRRGGERLSIAVLTDAQPSQAYAQETVRGVADRLLPG